MQELYIGNYKILLREVNEDMNNQKNIQFPWVRRIDIA